MELFSRVVSKAYRTTNFFFISEDSQACRYALSVDSTWVCGIRVIPAEWELVELPRLTGWVTKRILSHLPYVNRLFNPQSFSFLACDECWVTTGFEHAFPELLEHVCAVHKKHAALSWFDEDAPIYAHIQKKYPTRITRTYYMARICRLTGTHRLINRTGSTETKTKHRLCKRRGYDLGYSIGNCLILMTSPRECSLSQTHPGLFQGKTTVLHEHHPYLQNPLRTIQKAEIPQLSFLQRSELSLS